MNAYVIQLNNRVTYTPIPVMYTLIDDVSDIETNISMNY